MALTKQQQNVVDTVIQNDGLVKTSAIAGSGKTHTLVELVKELNPTSGIYLAYNKAIAVEAQQKFKGTTIKCSTIHSLAYGEVVKQYGLRVGFFGPRNVEPSTTSYKDKMDLVQAIEEFCLSAYTDPDEYLKANHAHEKQSALFWHHLNAMTNGEIQCTHSFYLKLYHIFLADGTIPAPEVDILLVDEAGDLTELTIEIFRLIKAPKKVAVGDPMQNIYSFNNTVNAFKVLQDEGISANLTESFRVSAPIAGRIEAFTRKYADKDFKFKGRNYPVDEEAVTTAYIARNNVGLLGEMFAYMEQDKTFHCTRKVEHILELPLVLANLSNGKPITEYKYKHIEKLRLEWERSTALQSDSSINSYVAKKLKGDKEISNAFRLVHDHGPYDLNNLVKYTRECAKNPCNHTFSTAHSSKGLEWDEVTLDSDMNEAVTDALIELKFIKDTPINAEIRNKYMEELRLYYVACSRAKLVLNNATQLPKG